METKKTQNSIQNTQNEKITLYIDADDTILNSAEIVVDIINKRYNITPKKTIQDWKDWGFRSIYKWLPEEEVIKIYESEELYSNVKVNEDFLNFYKRNQKYFNFVIVTKGSDENVKVKKKFLNKILGGNFEYITLPINRDKSTDSFVQYDKSAVNMKHGIQIDDRIECIARTNAPIKILFKNNLDRCWNRGYENIDNLYVVNTWKEIIQILLFVKDNHFLFKKK